MPYGAAESSIGERRQGVPLQQEGVVAWCLKRADKLPTPPRPLIEEPAQDRARRVFVVGGQVYVLVAVVASRMRPLGHIILLPRQRISQSPNKLTSPLVAVVRAASITLLKFSGSEGPGAMPVGPLGVSWGS